MQSSISTQPTPVDSIVVKQTSSEKPITTVLHSPTKKSQPPSHHLYNYWTLNERLRAKNEKLVRRQQASCRLVFCCLWLFLFGGVMIIVVYRFTDECSLISFDPKQFAIRCFRQLLLFGAISISMCGCSGIIFGACRYFRSQPKPSVDKEKYELHRRKNSDLSPAVNTLHTCCYQTATSNDLSRFPPQRASNPTDEQSNTTASSSLPHLSPQRKIPPFTYDELPPNQSPSQPPLSPLSILPNVIVNSNSGKPNRDKSAFFSSSTSASSSPQSNLSTTIITNTRTPMITTDYNKAKSTAPLEDGCATVSTSYTTCACGQDVWERRTMPFRSR